MAEDEAVDPVVLSSALERALRMVADKPRVNILTTDLAQGVIAAAERRLREDRVIGLMALQHVSISAKRRGA
jgi:uncharacterized protein with ACT and thioredoxin-like domain